MTTSEVNIFIKFETNLIAVHSNFSSNTLKVHNHKNCPNKSYLINIVIVLISISGDILQLVIVELIYKVCLANPNERSRFIRCIYNLLNSSSASVRYEVNRFFQNSFFYIFMYIANLTLNNDSKKIELHTQLRHNFCSNDLSVLL